MEHIRVMGLIQLEVLQELLSTRFGLAVTFDKPTVVYRETIAKEAVGFYACTHRPKALLGRAQVPDYALAPGQRRAVRERYPRAGDHGAVPASGGAGHSPGRPGKACWAGRWTM